MPDNKRIYLDHAATTPVCEEALQAMLPFFSHKFGNPNSLHGFGRDAMAAVEDARTSIADMLGVKRTEIFFTSGGTESDNWAIKGLGTGHVITSAIEHPAIMAPCAQLEKKGVKVTYLPVDKYGIVSPADLEKAITEQTSLVSVMLANNEIGTIQPIKELAEIARRHKIPFHTDAVQAVGNIPVDIKGLGVDLLSFSAHKFYGPKGIGALYIRSGSRIDKLITGGHQERTMRGGTTNAPLIVGMAAALKKAISNLERDNKYVRGLRDAFADRIRQLPHVIYNGHPDKRVPNNANFSFEFIEGESILMTLDLKGIACSSGSACSSASLEPSHVLLAMGVAVETAHGSIRFSFGPENTMDDVEYAASAVKETVERLRAMSPLFKQLKTDSRTV